MASTPGKLSDPGLEDPRLGAVVGQKYRLGRVVASGGMGAVFEAEHLRLGRRVAVKLLHPDNVTDSDLIKRFHKEAKKAASLTHAGIVDVRDFGHDPVAGPYLEMELLDGASVEQLLHTHGPLPLDVALHVTYAALDALAAAHSCNIVHRDLKPSNLYVSLAGGSDVRVKVLDFGIARIFTSELEGFALDDDTFSETLTKTGVLLGTLNYMSPEQFADARNVDHRADLYSMGATLFELLTNRPVVSGSTVYECVNHVMQGEVLRHPQVYRTELPRWVDALVARSLALLPSDRYQTAEDMRQAIAAHASYDEVATRKRLGELAEKCAHGAAHRASSEADTQLSGRERNRPGIESGPVIVVADADSGIREPTGSLGAGGGEQHEGEDAAPAQGLPGDSLRTPLTVEVEEDRSRPSRAGGTLRTAALVAVAIAVGAGGMALLRGGDPDTEPPPSEVGSSAPRTAAGPGAEARSVDVDVPEPGVTDGEEVAAEENHAASARETEPGSESAADADGEESTTSREPRDETTATTEGEASEELRAARRRRAPQREAQRRASRRSPAAERAAASRPTGRLTINTIPASRVYIDGRDTGHHTPLNDYEVPAGAHRLELRLPDGTSHSYPVRVEAGETERVFRVLPH